jgi:hypothetical protein
MTRTSRHLDAVRELADQGLTNPQIADRLGIARQTAMRIRDRLNIPGAPRTTPRQPTIEEVFHRYTQDADGGHLHWDGPRGSDGTPAFRHNDRQHTAYRVAFTLRTSRQPTGRVQADCDRPGCVAPAHVADREERQQVRRQLRALEGLPALPSDTCTAGHDQTTEGRIGPDGSTYCNTCMDTRRQRNRRKQVAA